MLDAMGQRYSVLPSELLRRGDSFDLMVMDVALSYQHYQSSKKDAKTFNEMLDTDDLARYAERVKNSNDDRQ